MKIRNITDVFNEVSKEKNFAFNEYCVGAGYDFETFTQVSAAKDERLLYALTDIRPLPDAYENSLVEGFVQTWSVYPQLKGITSPLKMSERFTEIYFTLRTFFENTSFVIENKTSDFDGFKIDGELLTGSASIAMASKEVKEEYHYLLELTIRR